MTKYIPAIFALCLVVFYCSGTLYHSSLNWGFHFLGFLPFWFTVLYLVLAVVIFYLLWKGYIHQFFVMVSQLDESKPWVVQGSAIVFFILCAFIFRVKVPLLGDSFLLLTGIENALSGIHELRLHRAPLSFSYFYSIASFLGVSKYPELLDAFFYGELVLGVGYIICVYYIVKLLITDGVVRGASFVLFVVMPFMLVFFGYAELYSMVVFTTALYCLGVVLTIKRKAPFWIVPPLFVLMVSANYLTIILFPGLLLVTIYEWSNGKRGDIIIGLVCSCLFVVGMLVAVGFDLTRFIPPSKQAHYLSLTGKGDRYEPYGLLSLFHLLDLGNLFLLLGIPFLFFFSMTVTKIRKEILKDIVEMFFLCSSVLIFGFLAIGKFDLGIAKDWDVNTPLFFLITLTGLVLFIRGEGVKQIYALTIIVCFTGLNSFVWFTLNSTTGGAVGRGESLLDTRMTSRDGYYQSVFHLSSYYQEAGLSKKMIEKWEEFITRVPDDWRAYQNLTMALKSEGETNDSIILSVYERWFTVDSSRAKREESNFLMERGSKYYKMGEINLAASQFAKAIAANPVSYSAYNNLATIYIDSSQYERAIELCKKAIQLNPQYALAYLNLGNSFLRKSEPDSALQYYQIVIAIDPKNLLGYENMSRAYYQSGDEEKALQTLKQAARFGSKSAQSLLRQAGELW